MSILKSKGRNTIFLTRRRIIITSIAFITFLSFLLINLFSLQIIKYNHYREKVYDQITTTSAVKAERGKIYDANMNLLASNSTVWRIFVSPKAIKRKSKKENTDYLEIIAAGLGKIFNTDSEQIKEKISKSNVLDLTLEKTATEEEYLSVLELVKKHRLEAMLFTEAQTTRYYPQSTLAAHVLGFVGSDIQGLYGLEYYYDDTLSGTDGYYLYAKDANGNPLPTEYATYVEAQNGCSIVTTIDSYVQSRLESILEEIRRTHNVQNRATGIVMDTKTGAILAMATTSPFDPNSPYELDSLSKLKLQNSGYAENSEDYKSLKKELLEVMWSNKAVSEIYEPGSTFKIITVSSALDSGSVKVNDTFSCNGYLTVGGRNIKCHKRTGHGSGFDLSYGLQMSCNPAMMTVGQKMGASTFYDYIDRFGYFEKTGIDLPSEGSTIFHEPQKIGTTELATISFGQRFKISIIRQLTSIAAIANDGLLVTPYVVQKVLDSEGNVISETTPTVQRRVVSSEVAKSVSKILSDGVSGNGGAKNAAVDGYEIAAKTGTSEKFDILDENGNSYLRIGSTVAFSNFDDSGIAAIIVVDEPMANVKYGSVVAAPYISALFKDILPYLGSLSSKETDVVKIDDYIGMNINTAKKKLNDIKIDYEIIGNGDIVINQTPTGSDPFIYSEAKVILYTEKDSEIYVTVPSVVGLDVSAANEIIINSGLNVRIIGLNTSSSAGATVLSQSLPEGTVAAKNSILEIEILHLDFED